MVISKDRAVVLLFLIWAKSIWAHDFEVLFPYSRGRDAIQFSGGFDTEASFRIFLVDGEVESVGTESVTYDRSLVTHIRSITNIPVTDRFFARIGLSGAATYRKVEGKDEPRTIKEETFYDMKPRIELTFYTQNALEVFTGINYRITSSFDSVTESIDLTTTESYSSAAMDSPHFGFVKRAGSFQGGFLFQQGVEKARSVKKTNNREDIILNLEDRIQDPTTISIFAQTKKGILDLFAEFSAIQAGEGGNKSDDGASVEEDYIKLSFSLGVPLGPVYIENTLIYKTLSYADSRNVSLRTIPQFGGHINANLQLGPLALSGGLILGYGKDSQSINEFNANYNLFAIGGSFSAIISF